MWRSNVLLVLWGVFPPAVDDSHAIYGVAKIKASRQSLIKESDANLRHVS